MKRTHLWCIHGNLQQNSVWKFLEDALPDSVELHLLDLWSSEASGFWDWADSFCQTVRPYADGTNVLLGYSLGGRLALHALLSCTELWDGAVIVAADSGLRTAQEREKRLVWDQAWGRRFLHDNWSNLFEDWDAQGVFANYPNHSARLENDFSRERIARLFDVFSKGRQDDLLPQLKALRQPKILYLSGEDDLKYSAVGRYLADECNAISHQTLSKAAHRVPWENQAAFTESLKAYLATLN